jgi:hypothetical protein
MITSQLPRDDESFQLLEEIIRRAVKHQISVNEFWEINSDPYSNQWEADQFDPKVQKRHCVEVSDAPVECDFADEDENPDSLTNCYVEICAKGVLADTLLKHGCGTNLIVDAFNITQGHSICILSDEDVDNDLSLMTVTVTDRKLLNGLYDALIALIAGGS